MFDVGWTELLLIGVVALIVVGPKDLPVMFRTLGQFTAKARGMAREFQRAMEDAAKDTGVNEISRDLREMTSPKKLGLDKLRELGSVGIGKAPAKGPATQQLSEERAEKAALIKEATANAATKRHAAEAANGPQATTAKPPAIETAAKPAQTGTTAAAQTAAKPVATQAAKPIGARPGAANGAAATKGAGAAKGVAVAKTGKPRTATGKAPAEGAPAKGAETEG